MVKVKLLPLQPEGRVLSMHIDPDGDNDGDDSPKRKKETKKIEVVKLDLAQQALLSKQEAEMSPEEIAEKQRL